MNAATVFSFFRQKRLPGQLVIQLTDRCNALCPQCGMRVTAPFKRSGLSVEDIKPILRAAAKNKVLAVSFTGGEPFLRFDDLITLMNYAGALGIRYIRTGTNGFLFQHPDSRDFIPRIERLADALAATPLRNFWISIDSYVPEVHERMRGFKGIVRGMEKALPVFHQRGLYPSANLGINRNLGGKLTRDLTGKHFQCEEDYLSEFYDRYRRAFDAYYRFVISLGFTIVNACYPMSMGKSDTDNGLSAVYAATATGDIVRFSPSEKKVLFKALAETVDAFRSRIRIFTPICSLYALQRHYDGHPEGLHPCRGGIDFFFIDAAGGDTFPCGYRGKENFGKFQTMPFDAFAVAPFCDACDWECFRDPSTLAGPMVNLLSAPVRELKQLFKMPEFYAHWVKDLRYYRACDFFDGRKPMRKTRPALFRRKAP